MDFKVIILRDGEITPLLIEFIQTMDTVRFLRFTFWKYSNSNEIYSTDRLIPNPHCGAFDVFVATMKWRVVAVVNL